VLEVIDIDLRLGGCPVLTKLSLRVRRGDIHMLVGSSGAGKTTLLSLIAGLRMPDRGVVRVGGVDVTHLPPRERPVGYLLQAATLFPHLSVRRNVEFGLRAMGMRSRERRGRVDEYLELCGATSLATRSPSELSGGQQRRVALARTLVLEPAVLLLDEPTAGLDPHCRRRLMERLQAIRSRLGITMLLVTHDMHLAAGSGDRIAVLADGHIERTDESGGVDSILTPCHEKLA
jgi:ABC-type Fe3+/spermidine/putrescine transport system ATPase subunit